MTESKIDPRVSMPSSSGGMKIKRPTTIFDDGEPTDSCLFDAKRVLRLIDDERYLSAEVLYHSILDRIATADADDEESLAGRKKKPKRKRNNSKKVLDKQEALQLLEENKAIVKKMEDRCQLFKRVKKNLDVHDDWTLAQTLFGVTTYYRHESDGSMSIKLEGPVNDCSLFDQVAVIREFDLNHTWAPFVTSSLTVGYLDKLDIVGWFLIGLPHFGLMRDALFRAIGCDSIYEDGSVLIVAYGIEDRPDEMNGNKDNNMDIKSKGSINDSCLKLEAEYDRIIDELRHDPILGTLDLPPVPTRLGGGRLTIRSVAAQIEVESPTSAITTLVANIDPNLNFLPQVLVDFVMKRVCGTILYKMKIAAKKVSKDPITNPHAIKIREENDFYSDFLLPKFEGICKIRGWEMPAVSVFDLSDAQLEMAEVFKAKQNQKSEKNALEIYNTDGSNNNLDKFLESSKGGAMNLESPSTNGPKLRHLKDLDEMSDISKSSNASSFWRSNPIANYQRQIEEKKQLRKDREIQEERDRAAARLKPKSLDEDAKIRLKELREARNRRLAGTKLPIVKENGHATPATSEDNKSCWKVSLASHGFFTKIFVIQFLMVFLFCLLYLETAFNKYVAAREGTFLMERARDAATLGYLGVAGFVHSVFCHIALIYAFTALQLGSIAGKRTRRFYSEYVHYVVAIASASMVGFGVIKPFLDQSLRWLIWNTYSISNFIMMKIEEIIPDKIETILYMVVNAIFALTTSTRKVFLESNILGQSLVAATRSTLAYIFNITGRPFASYANTAIKQYEGEFVPLPWREDAFFTTRALLSHSALFLLILLLLFNAVAKQARQTIYVDEDADKETQRTASIGSGSFSVNGKGVRTEMDGRD